MTPIKNPVTNYNIDGKDEPYQLINDLKISVIIDKIHWKGRMFSYVQNEVSIYPNEQILNLHPILDKN